MNKKHFSKMIKKQRLKLNLSQQDLADKLNLSRQAISQFEKGITIPSFYTTKKLAQTLNIKIRDDNNLMIFILSLCALIIVMLILFIII